MRGGIFPSGLWPVGVKKAGSTAPAWTPATVSGLKAWWKADGTLWQDAGSTPATADGDPVGRWEDASGLARHANQGTAGLKPILKIISGKNYVRFDGTDDLLTFTTVDLAAFTVFVVHTVTASAGTAFSGPLNWRTNSENGFQLNRSNGVNTAYTPHLTIWNGSSETANKERQAGSLGNGVALTEYMWSSTPALRITEADVTIATNVTGFNFLGGAIGKGFACMSGDIAEIFVYDSVLSAGNITLAETYLTGRWGV